MTTDRALLLRRGLALEYLSLAWCALEAIVGILAGLAAGSVALVGFGLDSVVESSSASILVWRLSAESSGRRTSHEVERKAVKGVALAFFAIATYVGAQSVVELVRRSEPHSSPVGIALAAVSIVAMPLLAWRKRKASRALGSHAMHADARQTILCSMLSVVLLVGLVANAVAGVWWADPVAGLLIAALAAREGRWLWVNEDPDCC